VSGVVLDAERFGPAGVTGGAGGAEVEQADRIIEMLKPITTAALN